MITLHHFCFLLSGVVPRSWGIQKKSWQLTNCKKIHKITYRENFACCFGFTNNSQERGVGEQFTSVASQPNSNCPAGNFGKIKKLLRSAARVVPIPYWNSLSQIRNGVSHISGREQKIFLFWFTTERALTTNILIAKSHVVFFEINFFKINKKRSGIFFWT